MLITILKLLLVSLIPIAAAAEIIAVKLHTSFTNWDKKWQTLLIAVTFGITSILGTVFSVKSTAGYGINVRDASPIIAGLLFGGPAGIFAGLIGGAYRFVAAYWTPELMGTQIACSISTVLAGILTAVVRKYIFNNHHGKWYYGIFLAVLVEDFHMLMVFLTNMNDVVYAYGVVENSMLPMMLANAFAVAASSMIACVIAKEKLFNKPSKLKMASKVQLTLSISLLVAYLATSFFSYATLKNASEINLEKVFSTTISDVRTSVDTEVDAAVREKIVAVKNYLNTEINGENDINSVLNEALTTYEISEINLINSDNIITYSTYTDYVGYEMASETQSNEFTCLLNGQNEIFIQGFIESGSGVRLAKYGGAKFENTANDIKYFQVGLYEDKYYPLLDSKVTGCATFRHVNKSGFVIVLNNDGNIVSKSMSAPDIENVDFEQLEKGTYTIKGNDFETAYYTKKETVEGYHIIAFGEKEESDLPSKVEFLAITTVEIFVFMVLYGVIFINIKRGIVNKIESVSKGLRKITDGDLNVVIDERNSVELDSLSNDINKTVDTLKENALKEAQKNAEELAFAKNIQLSALPTKFPNTEKFELFANMQTAKEVGGDFYDFYFVDREHLAIEIADVSGKGIPAAMFMMQSKTIIKNLVESGLPINEAIIQANKQLCEHNDAQMFVTAWIGIINLVNGRVDYVNAGHNPPLIKTKDGDFTYLKGKSGFVLGGFDEFIYTLQSFDIEPGDKIYLYTDGVTEAMDKDSNQYGEERLLKDLNKAKDLAPDSICNEIINSVKKFANCAEQSDDITTLCFALKEKESSERIEVAAKTENLEKVTQFADKFLKKHKISDKILSEINVAIDEIYSNVCNYAYKHKELGNVKLTIGFNESKNEASLIFEDHGDPYNPLKRPDPNANASLDEREIGGLGIFIVKKTMDTMTYDFINGANVLKITKKIR